MVVTIIIVVWMLLRYHCSWLVGPPTKEPLGRDESGTRWGEQQRKAHGGRSLPVTSPVYTKHRHEHSNSIASNFRKAYSTGLKKNMAGQRNHVMLAASITWSFDPIIKKGSQSEKGCGQVWETVNLITMALLVLLLLFLQKCTKYTFLVFCCIYLTSSTAWSCIYLTSSTAWIYNIQQHSFCKHGKCFHKCI